MSGSKRRITQTDRDVLNFIAWYKCKYGGESPTHRQIIKILNIKSSSHVSSIIDKLQDAGLLVRVGHHGYVLSYGHYTYDTDRLPRVGDLVRPSGKKA